MGVDLAEEQWSLGNGGADDLVFGNGTSTIVLKGGLDYGSAEIRDQDADRPQGDGSLFGRDYFGGPEWSLTLGVQHGLDVWSVLYPLAQAWRADSVRSQPGAMSVLRYHRNGQTYRILGRPRKFGISPADKRNHQFQTVACTFQLANPEVYLEPEDASTRTLRLNLIEAASDGGIVWSPDLTWPLELRPSSQARTGEVTVGGFRPAPFTVQVRAGTDAMSKIRLSGDGWQLSTSATLAPGQTLLIDTAANTITRAGVSLAGTLSRTSRLTARLQPGHEFIEFSATDPSNTGYAVVRWYDTLPA